MKVSTGTVDVKYPVGYLRAWYSFLHMGPKCSLGFPTIFYLACSSQLTEVRCRPFILANFMQRAQMPKGILKVTHSVLVYYQLFLALRYLSYFLGSTDTFA